MDTGPKTKQENAAHNRFLSRAIALAEANVIEEGGRPFGAVLVREGEIIAEGVNTIHRSGDLTAHAELEAIRSATRQAGSPRLDGTVMYASGHPCPMCLAAMYLGGVSEVYYAFSQEDGEPFGLSTAKIYTEFAKPPGERQLRMQHIPLDTSHTPYRKWQELNSGGKA